jgi:predicted O-methyltransferase YrrM
MKKWQDIDGPFYRAGENNKLQDLAKGKVVLEIGSWEGRSTVCMAEVAAHVYACDPHTAFNTQALGEEFISLEKFKENTAGRDNITLLLGKSEDMVPVLENNFFDLVFIDGDHRYASVKKDIEMSLPKLKVGGVMAFHDMGWDGAADGGVSKAVREVLGKTTQDAEIGYVTK